MSIPIGMQTTPKLKLHREAKKPCTGDICCASNEKDPNAEANGSLGEVLHQYAR